MIQKSMKMMMPLLLRIIVILQGNWTFESSCYTFHIIVKKIRSMHIVSAITYIYFGISYAI